MRYFTVSIFSYTPLVEPFGLLSKDCREDQRRDCSDASLEIRHAESLTIESSCSCRWLYQDFLADMTPSLKASLRLHRISSGMRPRPLKEFLKRNFSTPRYSGTERRLGASVLQGGRRTCGSSGTDLRTPDVLGEGQVVRCEPVVQERRPELQPGQVNSRAATL